jgi:hypothetical protein
MTLLQLVVLNACHFGTECHDLRSKLVIVLWWYLLFMILPASCLHISLSGTRGPKVRNWDNRRGCLWYEDHMCSPSVNALLRYFIKRSTLITSSFPWGPATNRLVEQKMPCKFLIASTYDYIRNTCLWLFSTRMLYHYLSAIAHVLLISWIILSMQRPFIHPYAYSILSYCLLLLLLPLLFYYCCYRFTTITTIKPLLLINRYEQVYF